MSNRLLIPRRLRMALPGLRGMMMGGAIVQPGSQTFTTPGANQFVVPFHTAVEVQLYGAGGGGSSGAGGSGSGGTASTCALLGLIAGAGGGGGAGGAGGNPSGFNTSSSVGSSSVAIPGAAAGGPLGGVGTTFLGADGNPYGGGGAGGTSGPSFGIGGGGGSYGRSVYPFGTFAVGQVINFVVGQGGSPEAAWSFEPGTGAHGAAIWTWY